MFLSIDRFDENYAICQADDLKLYAIKKSELPQNTKPGDILNMLPNGSLALDIKETDRRKKRIKKLQNKIFKID